jgi:hypothetical protein
MIAARQVSRVGVAPGRGLDDPPVDHPAQVDEPDGKRCPGRTTRPRACVIHGTPGLRRTSRPPSLLCSHDALFRQRSRVERSVRVGIERQIATTFCFRVTKARSGGSGAPLANRAVVIASFSLFRNWIMARLPVASRTTTAWTSFSVCALETIFATAAPFRRQASLGPTRRRGLPPPQPATTTAMAARSTGAVDARPTRLLGLAVGRTKDQSPLRHCLTADRSSCVGALPHLSTTSVSVVVWPLVAPPSSVGTAVRSAVPERELIARGLRETGAPASLARSPSCPSRVTRPRKRCVHAEASLPVASDMRGRGSGPGS